MAAHPLLSGLVDVRAINEAECLLHVRTGTVLLVNFQTDVFLMLGETSGEAQLR